MTQALAVTGVSSGYGASLVLREVSFGVAPGEIVAVLGKNGMGKTTLLRTIMGYLPARAGHVAAFGRDIAVLPTHQRRALGIAHIAQEQALFPDLTVRDNLRLGLADDGGLAAATERIARDFPFLSTRLAQKAGTLSGGEQKMLLLARALAGRPALLLIDEVTEGLQPSNVERVADVLRRQVDDTGAAILLTEQHVHFALRIARRYLVLERGEIVAEDACNEAAAGRVSAYLQV